MIEYEWKTIRDIKDEEQKDLIYRLRETAEQTKENFMCSGYWR